MLSFLVGVAVLSVAAMGQTTSSLLLAHAKALLASGDTVTAVLLLLEHPSATVRGSEAQELLARCIEGAAEIKVFRHSGPIAAVAYASSGELAAASTTNSIRVWGVEGDLRHTLSGHAGGPIDVSYSPDGLHLLSVSEDSVRLWSRDGKLVHLVQRGPQSSYGMHEAPHASFSGDGMSFVTVLGERVARVWTIGGRSAYQVEQPVPITGAILSRDGTYLLTLSRGPDAWLWSSSGRQAVVLAHREWVKSAAFSPDQNLIASATGGYLGEESGFHEGAVYVWTIGGNLVRTGAAHANGVEAVQFSMESDAVLVSSAGTARVWTIPGFQATGSPTLHAGHVYAARFAKDQQRFFTVAGSSGMFTSTDYSVRSGHRKYAIDNRIFAGHEGAITALAVSAAHERMATGGEDGTVRLWDYTKSVDDALPGDMPGNRKQIPIDAARRMVPRCLTPAQRKHFGLAESPPAWCLSGQKWPYDTMDATGHVLRAKPQ